MENAMILEKGSNLRNSAHFYSVIGIFLFSFCTLLLASDKQKESILQLKEIKSGKYCLYEGKSKVFILQYHIKDQNELMPCNGYIMQIPAVRELGSCPELIIKPASGWRIDEVKVGKVLNIDDEIVLRKGNLIISIRCNLFGYKIDNGTLFLLLRSNCFGIMKVKIFKDGSNLVEGKYDLLIDWNGNSQLYLGDGTLCWENQGVQGGTN